MMAELLHVMVRDFETQTRYQKHLIATDSDVCMLTIRSSKRILTIRP